MLFEQAGEYILNKLRNERPAHLSYHNEEHVLDVHYAAERIGKQEGIDEQQMQHLLTAALFHDSGFIFGPEEHEEQSCNIAREVLPQFEYTYSDIDTICELIKATHLPQTPKSHLGQILADADLDYLGREDFQVISNNLFKELAFTGKINCELEWRFVEV